MTDNVSRKRRSEIMSAIRSTDTQPEIKVRSMIHGMGYRFRLHVVQLPGKPDIVLTKHRKIVLVHGCFWHSHSGCHKARPPKSNSAFWLRKLQANRVRDKRVREQLRREGWQVFVVWQCKLRKPANVRRDLAKFLER